MPSTRPAAPRPPEWMATRRVLLGTAAGAAAMATMTSIRWGETSAASVTDAPFTRGKMTMPNDPLPSWNDGATKQAILDFVAAVTEEGGDQFVPEGDRIATFDNDGTLWVEHPLPVQGFFALDTVKRMAPEHPEWQDEQPFAAILSGDQAAMSQFSEHDLAAIIAATHAGMTTTAFAETARAWIASAKHPRFDQRFTACVYQPQLELLDFLRANGFQTFIVSGGGVDFMRTFAEETYGIPPGQVIGSSGQVKYEIENGTPVLIKEPQISSIDNREGKPINIHLHIGKPPILAFGNSDGDQQMLEYTGAGGGPRLCLLVHHDDAGREYAYDREDAVGKLDTAWDQAIEKGWTVVSMKDDWNRVFPFEE